MNTGEACWCGHSERGHDEPCKVCAGKVPPHTYETVSAIKTERDMLRDILRRLGVEGVTG